MLRPRILRNKLALALAGAALLTFAVAGAALVLYESLALEGRAREVMEPYARLVSVGAEAAVRFEDSGRAQEILNTLQANPHILAAEIVLANGGVLAKYGSRGRATVQPPALKPDGLYLFLDSAELTEPLPDGAHLHLILSLDELRKQTRSFVLVLAGALLVLLTTITLGLRVALQRTIVGPISTLAETVEQVRTQADYRQRVPAAGTDEVARLGQSFNAMMGAIQERDSELRELNLELDQRVHERTAWLEAAIKELEAFAYSVSHDLRAPLRAIDGFSRALLDDCAAALDEVGKQHLNRVRAAAQRMSQLIDDMLNLSRVTRAELRTEQVDLSRLTEDIAAELAQSEPERRVTVIIAPEAVVTGDSHLLRQALENLVGNAWKFTSKRAEARIEFGVTEEADQPVYFVRDNGAGFDMNYAGKLFGAFQRLHTAGEFPGTGIGLATVQRIIQRHGGRVWATGEVGVGATFYFALPRTLPIQGLSPIASAGAE